MLDGRATPPSVASTARRHGATHTRDGQNTFSISSLRNSASGRQSQPHSLLARQWHGSSYDVSCPLAQPRRRARRASPAETVRQRLHSTLAVAEAEAVRAARDFSMEMYRGLHQRKFASLHEELDFLRKDFIASRRTLALLHEDNVRLERELLSRVRQVEELQDKLAELYREMDEGTWKASPSPSSLLQRGDGAARSELNWYNDDAADGAPMECVTETTEEAGEKVSKAGHASTSTAYPSDNALLLLTAPPTPHAVPRPTQRTPLALYAKTTKKRKPGTLDGEANVNPRELIRDLRANLARRDTSLNEVHMELSALQHEQQHLRTELSNAQRQLLEVKQQRDKLQGEATAREEAAVAQAVETEGCHRQIQQLEKEKEDLQRRLTTAELLYEHTGSKVEDAAGLSSTDPDAARKRVEGAVLPDCYLRDQLQLYRTKWQAAEDEVEHLHQRLSQLQRQLVVRDAVDPATAAASCATRQETEPGTSGGDEGRIREIAAQHAEHAAELEALRRQHKEQLQLHAEEIQRLQRRLDRCQEDATFHEDQLRQQRQDDSRQHSSEVQRLQSQLRTAQRELAKAQQDREHLARQLRRSTEQETMVEVLRGQVDQLKQRLGEVGAELAQVRGREKETNLNIQRERMSRAKAEHDTEAAQEALARAQKDMQYLQEELQLLREQLGVQEASKNGMRRRSTPHSPTSGEGLTAGESQVQPSVDTPGDDGGDAATLASELKGYVSLMRVNTALQRRIAELEAQVASLRQPSLADAFPQSVRTPDATQNSIHRNMISPQKAVVAAAGIATSHEPHNSVAVVPDQRKEVERLNAELEKVLQAQRELLANCVAAETDRRMLAADNVTLASGIELLEKQLRKARAAAAMVERARSRRSRESTQLSRQSRQSGGERNTARKKTRSRSPLCNNLPSISEDSRLRQRLQTARAQDQSVAHDERRRNCSASTTPTAHEHASSCPDIRQLIRCSCCCCCGCDGKPRCSPALSPPTQASCQHHDTHAPIPPASSPPNLCCHAVKGMPCAGPATTQPELSPSAAPLQSLAVQPSATSASASPVQPSGQHVHEAAENVTHPPSPGSTPVVAAPAVPARRDASSSPPRSPQRHIHGSVLPPVRYPSLILRSRA
jgi:hypothetical protein